MTGETDGTTRHGTALVPAGADAAVLLRGPSGAGKSDLAFRMIAEGAARLIADDRVLVAPAPTPGGFPVVSCPPALAGLIEVRGLGIVTLAAAERVGPRPLALIVDLVARDAVPRLPAPDPVRIGGAAIPRLSLHAFDASTPAKIARAVALIAVRTRGTGEDSAGDGAGDGTDRDGIGAVHPADVTHGAAS